MNKVPGLNSNVFFDPVGLPFSQVPSFPSGAIAYYKLDETSGTTAIDSVAGNDGTNNGATVNVAGKIGKAYSFTVNDYVNLDAILSEIEDNTKGTICTWIKPVSALPSSPKMIFSVSNKSGLTHLIINIKATTGLARVVLVQEGIINFIIETTVAPFTDDTWSHITVIQDVTPKIYIDNIEVAQTLTGGSTADWLNDLTGLDAVRIGSLNWNSSGEKFFYEGLIDELCYFNRGLTSNEREYVMNNTYPS